MFIELIDTLRCPENHRDSWLVASITERDDRLVREGLLGCPVCGREYPIARGIAWFERDPGARPARAEAAPVVDVQGEIAVGALLAPREGSAVALCGAWASYATALVELIPLRVFAVNPVNASDDSEFVGTVETAAALPFAAGALSGVALGATATQDDAASAVRALADGARLVGPVSLPVPSEISVLVRDDAWWAGEKRGALIGLRRA